MRRNWFLFVDQVFLNTVVSTIFWFCRDRWNNFSNTVIGLDSDDWLEDWSICDDLDVKNLCLSDLVAQFAVLMGSKSED